LRTVSVVTVLPKIIQNLSCCTKGGLLKTTGIAQKRLYSIPKISRPVISGIIPRKRLFRQLKENSDKPFIWITGPPGSGKTSLIASYIDTYEIPCLWYQIDEGDNDIPTFFYYMGLAARKAAPNKKKPMPLLTPEYMFGIPAFTRRYFEELFGRLKTPCAVVFDNYQNIQGESQLNNIFEGLVNVMPEGIQIIIICRRDPPAQFIRLRANQKMGIINWNDLRFSFEEANKIVCFKHRKPGNELLQRIYEKVDGWAAGIILMTEQAQHNEIDFRSIEKFNSGEVFDYFSGEVFDRTAKEIQDFLLKTSFLTRITVQVAEKLTNIQMSEQILSELSRDNYFTEKKTGRQPSYQYHPLFREFLQSKAAAAFSAEETRTIKQTAAGLLEESEYADDSIQLYIYAGDWESAARLILKSAQSMVAQGRNRVLEEWLTKFPDGILQCSPWLLYWIGICHMPISPLESRKYLEKAFELFNRQKDDAGTFLSCAAVVDSIIHEWDEFAGLDYWIKWLDNRMATSPSFPSLFIEAFVLCSMVGALQWRKPDHPEIEKLFEKALTKTKETGDVNLHFRTCIHAAIYYSWTGNFGRSYAIAEDMKKIARSQSAQPLLLVTWKYTQAIIFSQNASMAENVIQAVREGLEIAKETGVHICDNVLYAHGVFGSMCTGDLKMAGYYLQKDFETLDTNRRNAVSQYIYLEAWHNFLTGNISNALARAETSLKISIETGTPFPELMCRLLMALILVEAGQYQEASKQIVTARELSLKLKSSYFEYVSELIAAYLFISQNNVEICLESLKIAMKLGREKGYFTSVFLWKKEIIVKLCMKALENGIEIKYVQELIRILKLVPDELQMHPDNWPYPVRIFTLGRFSLLIDNRPVEFSGKVQKKPLMMLKALVSLGGRGIREDHLSDALWPDASGDDAHNAFTTTLSRLRRIINNENAITFNEGRLTLDSRFCWVDLWVFERLTGQAEDLWKHILDIRHAKLKDDQQIKNALQFSEKAISAYKGLFLPSDDTESWTVSMREKLKSRFIRLMVLLCEYYEGTEQWEKASLYCNKGLEIDNLSEEFYRKLMTCYQRLGRTSDAVSVYSKCCRILSSVMGVDPSPGTTAVYNDLMEKNKIENSGKRMLRDNNA